MAVLSLIPPEAGKIAANIPVPTEGQFYFEYFNYRNLCSLFEWSDFFLGGGEGVRGGPSSVNTVLPEPERHLEEILSSSTKNVLELSTAIDKRFYIKIKFHIELNYKRKRHKAGNHCFKIYIKKAMGRESCGNYVVTA